MAEAPSNQTGSRTGNSQSWQRWSRVRSWSALGLAVIAIILALTMRDGLFFGNPSACTSQPTPAPTTIAGLSAYDLWLKVGNKGTEQDFLKSLIGTPGKDGYVGSNGLTGATGTPGATGAAGTPGESAYQVWLDNGHTGTPQDFLDSLAGAAGSAGTAGIAGLSAYELWSLQGHVGTEADFLASLVGAPGVPGAAGVCTVGETGATGATGAVGANGADGLSAYQIWLSNGHTGGTQSEFLASLVGAAGSPGASGAQGEQGPQGVQGPVGPAGPAGISGLGASGSFWSDVSQSAGAANSIHAMTLNQSDWQNGVTLESSSHLKMVAAGKYNIAFSAQIHQTNSSGVVNIWLARNGVAVPDTNTQMDITANSPFSVAAWNFFVNASAGDYYELMWSSDDNHTVIQYEPSVGSGASLIPAVPSLIVTVNQVG